MEQSPLSKYDRVKVTACANLTFINDVLTQSVMSLIQEAKRLGIYCHKRKQILNQMFKEIQKYERFILRESGDLIWHRAEQCEAFTEQVESAKQTLLAEAEKVLIDGDLPNTSYLAYIHLTRVTFMAADVAIRGWDKKLRIVASPRKSTYNMNIFRQEKFHGRLQQLISFDLASYQDRKTESEGSEKATREYLMKLTDTDMICRIMGGQIKASWVLEDEANKTAETSVIKE